MSTEIKVPLLPESVADALVATWHKKVGDSVERDENIVDLETDKVMLEVPSPVSGVIKKLHVKEGDTVLGEQVIATIDEGAVATSSMESTETPSSSEPEVAPETVAEAAHSPAVRRLLSEHQLDPNTIQGTGKSGRITKQDIENHLANVSVHDQATGISSASTSVTVSGARTEERVPMSRLRQRVAERLVEVQNTAAILTTFNEVDMAPVMTLRAKYKESFEKTHDTRLGFMSFFVKATVEALKEFPSINASIDGNDIVYHAYQDIGIAIGSPRGLVVPILRDAERMSMADIEKNIRDYSKRAQTGKLSIEEITGGTFSITNGGTFGSMLSTPIINPPQSAILGMHNIVERPVVLDGEIVVRPIMYLALSYDHRIVDGRESILFLVRIKELLEDPNRLLLQV